jgi:hypothetical protein
VDLELDVIEPDESWEPVEEVFEPEVSLSDSPVLALLATLWPLPEVVPPVPDCPVLECPGPTPLLECPGAPPLECPPPPLLECPPPPPPLLECAPPPDEDIIAEEPPGHPIASPADAADTVTTMWSLQPALLVP